MFNKEKLYKTNLTFLQRKRLNYLLNQKRTVNLLDGLDDLLNDIIWVQNNSQVEEVSADKDSILKEKTHD